MLSHNFKLTLTLGWLGQPTNGPYAGLHTLDQSVRSLASFNLLTKEGDTMFFHVSLLKSCLNGMYASMSFRHLKRNYVLKTLLFGPSSFTSCLGSGLIPALWNLIIPSSCFVSSNFSVENEFEKILE